MEIDNYNFEDYVSAVSVIASDIGIALAGVNNLDLFQLREHLVERVGNEADKILSIAERMVNGIYPNKELDKLKRRLDGLKKPVETEGKIKTTAEKGQKGTLKPIEVMRQIATQRAVKEIDELGKEVEHWSFRNRLATSRLPNTGAIYSRSVQTRPVHRGVGRYSKVR